MTPSEEFTGLLLPDVRTAIDTSGMNRVKRGLAAWIAPLLIRWVIEIALSRWGATLADLFRDLLPILRRWIRPEPALLARLEQVGALLNQAPSTFDAPVRSACRAMPAADVFANRPGLIGEFHD